MGQYHSHSTFFIIVGYPLRIQEYLNNTKKQVRGCAHPVSSQKCCGECGEPTWIDMRDKKRIKELEQFLENAIQSAGLKTFYMVNNEHSIVWGCGVTVTGVTLLDNQNHKAELYAAKTLLLTEYPDLSPFCDSYGIYGVVRSSSYYEMDDKEKADYAFR